MVAIPPNASLADIWERVRAWPAADRTSLAEKIIESLAEEPPRPKEHSVGQQPLAPTGNLADIIGLWRDVQPMPTDEELDRILEQSMIEKHG
ncbi:MAG: hypothetical protein WD872_20600 [Pirellulaceae bacterium]